MLAGFAIVISEDPGILVELAMAVSPTLISRLVITPSMGEIIWVRLSCSSTWSSCASAWARRSREDIKSMRARSNWLEMASNSSSPIKSCSCRLRLRSYCLWRLSIRTSCRSMSMVFKRTAASACSTLAIKFLSSTLSTSCPVWTVSPSSTYSSDTLPITSELSITSSSCARNPEARIDGLITRWLMTDTLTSFASVPNTMRLMNGSAITVAAMKKINIIFLVFILIRLDGAVSSGLLVAHLSYHGAVAQLLQVWNQASTIICHDSAKNVQTPIIVR